MVSRPAVEATASMEMGVLFAVPSLDALLFMLHHIGPDGKQDRVL